jgi:hypothetical protein
MARVPQGARDHGTRIGWPVKGGRQGSKDTVAMAVKRWRKRVDVLDEGEEVLERASWLDLLDLIGRTGFPLRTRLDFARHMRDAFATDECRTRTLQPTFASSINSAHVLGP